MYLVLSGEGASDMGSQEKIGPMAKIVDQLISNRIDYSIIEYKAYIVVPKKMLTDIAKDEVKPRSRKGKEKAFNTRFFYKNARALAIVAKNFAKEQGIAEKDLVAVLFRDADPKNSTPKGEWQEKMDAVYSGFAVENFHTGVAMIPKPQSEAWVMCALRDNYQHCERLENEPGNDSSSPNSLKIQLKKDLDEDATRDFLNEKIDAGELNIHRIDMPSANVFKQRLNDVLTALGLPISK
jgi:hypothetical protein